MSDQDQERQQQRDKAQKWLKRHWTNVKNCIVCGNNRWTVADVIEMRPFTGGSLILGGGVYPFFPVVCDTCGNTLLFAALPSGVIEPPAEEKPTDG